MYCFKCGRLIDNDSVFCEFCGARFEDRQQNTNNQPYGNPSYGQNNQFMNQPNNNVNRGYNAPPIPDVNMRGNVNQSPYNYQVPPVQPQPKPQQKTIYSQNQNYAQQDDEMSEIYHKYMDDQYMAVDSKGNNIVAASSGSMQGVDNIEDPEFSRNFKIIATVLTIFSLLGCGAFCAELIAGIVLKSKGRKKEGNLLIILFAAAVILRIIFGLITGTL